jgi:chromosome segregation ATPase
MLWRKLFATTLFALVSVLFLVSQDATSSPKDSLINALTQYQMNLLQVKASITSYEQAILSYNLQIADLQQQLNDSKDKSTLIIADLTQQLTDSKLLLDKQQQDLEKLQKVYNQLSTELNRLKVSYEVSRNTTKVLVIALLAVGGYEGGRALKWWK